MAGKNTVVYTVGRFNPITRGHEKLIDTVESVARKENADAVVFPTASYDSKKNPLKFEQKIYFLKKTFPKVIFSANKKIANPFAALDYLVTKYDHIIFFVGGDRIQEMQSKLEGYFNRSILPDHPQKTIEIISAGERGAIKVGGKAISGTTMRIYAENDDFQLFSQGVPSKMSPENTRKMFNAVRSGMGLV